jgi:hypothetical protein
MSTIFFAEEIQQLENTRASLRISIEVMIGLHADLENKINYLRSFHDHMNDMGNYIKDRVTASVTTVIALNLRGTLFQVETEHLNSYTFFQALLFSEPAPSRDQYFIDRPFEGFDRIVNAMRGGELSYEGLNDYEAQCIDGNLKYFQLPFPRFKVVYNTVSKPITITSKVSIMCPLLDGQLCIGFSDNCIKIWNPTTNFEEGLLLIGDNDVVRDIIQLSDGRVCITAGQMIKIFSKRDARWVLELDMNSCDGDWKPRKLVQYSDTKIICGIARSVSRSKCKCKVQVWNVDTQVGSCEKSFSIADQSTVFGILPNQKLWSTTFNGRVEILDINREEFSFSFDTKSNHLIQLASGNLCSCSYFTGFIFIWDYTTGQMINQFNLRFVKPKTNSHHLLLRDGRVCFSLINSDEDSCLLFYDIENDAFENSEVLHHADVSLFAQCKDGRLCCYSEDYSEDSEDYSRSISFWSMQ